MATMRDDSKGEVQDNYGEARICVNGCGWAWCWVLRGDGYGLCADCDRKRKEAPDAD